MEEQMNDKLPQTDSIQELAKFWDRHDLTDFEDELEEVRDPVFDRSTVVKLHLSSNEAKAVEEIARTKGVDPADLIHEWVAEKSHRP
jgi:predicted DNA binding CopG/RHH family protein